MDPLWIKEKILTSLLLLINKNSYQYLRPESGDSYKYLVKQLISFHNLYEKQQLYNTFNANIISDIKNHWNTISNIETFREGILGAPESNENNTVFHVIKNSTTEEDHEILGSLNTRGYFQMNRPIATCFVPSANPKFVIQINVSRSVPRWCVSTLNKDEQNLLEITETDLPDVDSSGHNFSMYLAGKKIFEKTTVYYVNYL